MADLLKRIQIGEQEHGVGLEENPFKGVSPDHAMHVCFKGGAPPPPPPLLLHNKQVTYLNILGRI